MRDESKMEIVALCTEQWCSILSFFFLRFDALRGIVNRKKKRYTRSKNFSLLKSIFNSPTHSSLLLFHPIHSSVPYSSLILIIGDLKPSQTISNHLKRSQILPSKRSSSIQPSYWPFALILDDFKQRQTRSNNLKSIEL